MALLVRVIEVELRRAAAHTRPMVVDAATFDRDEQETAGALLMHSNTTAELMTRFVKYCVNQGGDREALLLSGYY